MKKYYLKDVKSWLKTLFMCAHDGLTAQKIKGSGSKDRALSTSAVKIESKGENNDGYCRYESCDVASLIGG
jgi:hypothetical protein